MWSVLALGVAERIINTLIDLDPIARQQCVILQGKLLRVVLDSPQLSVDVRFDTKKLHLEPTPTGQSDTPSLFEQRPFDIAQHSTFAHATLHVENLVQLLKLLLSQDEQIGTIPVQGDYQLFMQLKTIMQNSELDLASALTPYLGATMAHEVGKMQHLPKHLWRQGENQLYLLQDYIKEDSGLIAPRWQMDELQQQTRQLNQELDRLEAKLQQLQQQIH